MTDTAFFAPEVDHDRLAALYGRNPADGQAFAAKTSALVSQFNAYVPLPGGHINGQLTLGENIADLSGLVVAHEALDQLAAGGEGEGRAAIAPILQQDEGARCVAVGIESSVISVLGDDACWVERPEGGLQQLHGEQAERLRDRLCSAP